MEDDSTDAAVQVVDGGTIEIDASGLLVQIKRMVAEEVQLRLGDTNTLSELSAILEAMVTDYLERHPPAAVNPRPDSMTIGKQSEQLKVYFNALDTDEQEVIRKNALDFREAMIEASADRIAERPEELRPKPRAAKKGADNGD